MNSRNQSSIATRTPFFWLALCLLSAACSDDGNDTHATTSGSPSGTDSLMSQSGSDTTSTSESPAFVVGTRVWNDTATTSYFHVLPAIAAGTSVDVSQALEMPGPAKLYALDAIDWFALGSGEEPAITRYSFNELNRLQPGTTISLQPQGVQNLWDNLYVASPTRVYYPDGAGQQLIVLNPVDMAVEGTIPLPQTGRAGYLAVYGGTPVVRDGVLLFSVGWYDWESSDSILGETGLVAIDTANNQVLRVDVDTRCGGISQAVTVDTGDTYFVSSALAAAAHRLGRLPTKPCALRIAAGTSAFDAAYAPSLDTITGTLLAGEPVPAGGNHIFLRTFDEALGTIKPDDQSWTLTGQAAWRWSRWDVVTGQVDPVSQLQPATADVLWFKIDGRVFGSQTKEDYSETTLIELTAVGGPTPALTVPGFLHGVARVR